MRTIRDIIPKRLVPARRGPQANDLSDQLIEAAHADAAAAVTSLRTRPA